MENVTLVWCVGGAAALVLGALCVLIWAVERRQIAGLLLFMLGVSTCASAYFELGMMHSATPEEYGAWLRWYHLPIFVALLSEVLFVHFYLGTSRLWLLAAAILGRLVVLAINFMVSPNINFVQIESLKPGMLLGNQISMIAAAVPRPYLQPLAIVTTVVIMVYFVDSSIRRWRRSDFEFRRRAAAVIIGCFVPLFLSNLYTQLLVFGVLHGTVSNAVWFLGTLLVMGFVSGRDFVQSRRALIELAELKNRLTQIERVTMMGQLASALAHELTQPLTAVKLNISAALRRLSSKNPDIEEIEEILSDIRSDDERAIEIIERMRRLFKERAIEVQPVKFDDIAHDVQSLLEGEARSKKIDILWTVPPDFPKVLCDRVHISQVLLNLIINAIQAIQGSPVAERKIMVKARSAADEVEVLVQDSGPGLSSAIIDQIFSPLFTTKSDGLGMGLALSKTIIEAHGGRLWAVTADQRGGAVFHFTLRPALDQFA